MPLKLCNRCRVVAYHDVQCQRVHYPLHRQQCTRQMFQIESQPFRGQCLVATQTMPCGMALDQRGFEPMVPPVLNQNERQSRCSVCFQNITNSDQAITLCWESKYCVRVCSSQCLQKGNEWLDAETQVVKKVLTIGLVPLILPMALLIFRFLRAISQQRISWDFIMSLCVHRDTHSQEAQIHEMGVQQTVYHLVRIAGRNNNDLERIKPLLNRVKINAFTITDNGKSLGYGMFHTVHRINHSCSPNACQSFLFQTGHYPIVRIHASQDIMLGQEITIAYINTSLNTAERQDLLEQNYHFRCTCPRCLQ